MQVVFLLCSNRAGSARFEKNTTQNRKAWDGKGKEGAAQRGGLGWGRRRRHLHVAPRGYSGLLASRANLAYIAAIGTLLAAPPCLPRLPHIRAHRYPHTRGPAQILRCARFAPFGSIASSFPLTRYAFTSRERGTRNFVPKNTESTAFLRKILLLSCMCMYAYIFNNIRRCAHIHAHTRAREERLIFLLFLKLVVILKINKGHMHARAREEYGKKIPRPRKTRQEYADMFLVELLGMNNRGKLLERVGVSSG